jgi:hypothetical protein
MEEKKIEWAMPTLVELGNAGYTVGAPCGPGISAGDGACTDGTLALGTCNTGTTVNTTCGYGLTFG